METVNLITFKINKCLLNRCIDLAYGDLDTTLKVENPVMNKTKMVTLLAKLTF